MFLNLFDTVLRFLRTVNESYSNVALLVVAIVSALVAYHEYSMHRRPYVIPEIRYEIVGDEWHFFIVMVNKGEYPAKAKITKAELRIGDEKYPTVFDSEILLSSGESRKIAPIGHINKMGRANILARAYISNRVEIEVQLDSKSLGQESFRYQANGSYLVNVSSTTPNISIIKEEMR